eukprot:12471931-Ditylum_brightwellii.AAC.1
MYHRCKKIGIRISGVAFLKAGVPRHHSLQRVGGDAAGARGFAVSHPLEGGTDFEEGDRGGEAGEVGHLIDQVERCGVA